jgi:uncharacterized membrane protein YeaQ/YmgE (transglycosylase-associated protein family)
MHIPGSFCIEYIIAGGIGGLVGTLARCGYLELPQIHDGRVYLGALSGIIFGAVAGCIGDSNPVNAFAWGTAGTVVVTMIAANVERNCKQLFDSKNNNIPPGN